MNVRIIIGDDNMKNNKGFTLVELLAVIVVLAIILVIAGTNVSKSIEDTRKKTKYIAAKEIVDIASAYIYEKGKDTDGDYCYSIDQLGDYLENDVTNPYTGDNSWTDKNKQGVCLCDGKIRDGVPLEKCNADVNDYVPSEDNGTLYYYFDNYKYYIIK